MFFASRPASRRRTVRFTPRPDGLEDRALLNVFGLHSAGVVVALDSSNGNHNGGVSIGNNNGRNGSSNGDNGNGKHSGGVSIGNNNGRNGSSNGNGNHSGNEIVIVVTGSNDTVVYDSGNGGSGNSVITGSGNATNGGSIVSQIGVGNVNNNGDANTSGKEASGGNTVYDVSNSGDFKNIDVRQ